MHTQPARCPRSRVLCDNLQSILQHKINYRLASQMYTLWLLKIEILSLPLFWQRAKADSNFKSRSRKWKTANRLLTAFAAYARVRFGGGS